MISQNTKKISTQQQSNPKPNTPTFSTSIPNQTNQSISIPRTLNLSRFNTRVNVVSSANFTRLRKKKQKAKKQEQLMFKKPTKSYSLRQEQLTPQSVTTSSSMIRKGISKDGYEINNTNEDRWSYNNKNKRVKYELFSTFLRKNTQGKIKIPFKINESDKKQEQSIIQQQQPQIQI